MLYSSAYPLWGENYHRHLRVPWCNWLREAKSFVWSHTASRTSPRSSGLHAQALSLSQMTTHCPQPLFGGVRDSKGQVWEIASPICNHCLPSLGYHLSPVGERITPVPVSAFWLSRKEATGTSWWETLGVHAQPPVHTLPSGLEGPDQGCRHEASWEPGMRMKPSRQAHLSPVILIY